METNLKNTSLEFIPLEAGLKADEKTKTLFGVQVAMLGTAKGHGMELDETTLDQIVALGNAASKGVKARFGHPTECTPGLGTFLGTRDNFRRDGQYVRADLHLSEAANPAYAEHVLSMAKLHPEKIGNSVVVSGERFYRKDEDGNRLRDDDEKELLPVLRVKHLHAVDVVDEPAAGDGMFAAPVDGVEFSPKTIVEFRDAMSKPGFLERVARVVLGRASVGSPENLNDADPIEGSEEKEVTNMSALTLKDFKSQHPEVAKEYAEELSAGHAEALAAATVAGADAERERVSKMLSRAKPHHFTKTAAHKDGFVLHAIQEKLSYEQILEGMYDLDAKANTLVALETASADIPVGSLEPAEKQLSAAQVVDMNFAAAVERHNQKGGA